MVRNTKVGKFEPNDMGKNIRCSIHVDRDVKKWFGWYDVHICIVGRDAISGHSESLGIGHSLMDM